MCAEVICSVWVFFTNVNPFPVVPVLLELKQENS